MKRIPLFSQLSDDLLKRLANEFVVITMDPNKIIFEENAIGDNFYIIARGSVAISKADHDHENKIVSVLETGDFFGEIALLFSSTRTARATTREACTFLVMYRTQFVAFLKQIDAPLRDKIMATAKQRKDQSH